MIVNGTTAEGFEGVRDVFAKNFTDGLEIGASFAAYYNGLKVVDLWGGVADPNQNTPWDERTLALVFSTTKGMTAMCANRLAQEGKLDLDAPVAMYWPEFAAGGKETMPVSYLLSHQAGSRGSAASSRPKKHSRGIPLSICSRSRRRTGNRALATVTTQRPTAGSSAN